MARHTETPETPSGERCRAASPTSLFQPSRDHAQMPCGAHSQGTEAAAGSLSQPGAATSQLRCRDPGLTKNLLYHHATVCVSFHSSLVASTTILEAGSQLFFVSSYSYSSLMCACKYYNTHKLLVALQVHMHHTLKYSDSCHCLIPLSNQLYGVRQGRFHMPQTNLFPSLFIFWQQRLLMGSGFLHLENSL